MCMVTIACLGMRLLMGTMHHLTLAELEAGLDGIRQSPKAIGVVVLIVRRPEMGAREVVDEGALDVVEGLVGDNWRRRGSSSTADGSAHLDMQLTLMNARVIALIAPDAERWQLAGDQIFLDMDVSAAHLPPGTLLAVGSAVIEVTAQPHTGCKKFVERFGRDAMKFVNSPVGKQLNLRGINAKVVQAGVVRVGDMVQKRSEQRSP